jgi:activator of HSP90 ATPase
LKDIVPEYNYTPNDQPLTKTHSINVQVEAAQADGKKANPVTEASLSDFKNQTVTPEQKVK